MDGNSTALDGGAAHGERTTRKMIYNQKRVKILAEEDAEKKVAAEARARARAAKVRLIPSDATSAVTTNAVRANKQNGTIGAGAGVPHIAARSSATNTMPLKFTTPTSRRSDPNAFSSVSNFSSSYQLNGQVDNIDNLDKEDPLCATDYVQEMVSILHVALASTMHSHLVLFSPSHQSCTSFCS